MSERKIPAFLSAAHHAASSIEAKRKLLEAYDIWACSDITKSYIIFLEKELQRLLKEDEEKTAANQTIIKLTKVSPCTED